MSGFHPAATKSGAKRRRAPTVNLVSVRADTAPAADLDEILIASLWTLEIELLKIDPMKAPGGLERAAAAMGWNGSVDRDDLESFE